MSHLSEQIPKVSVVIPVYNRPEQVVEAIESVFEQSFTNWEIIVVDDGSTPPLELPSSIARQKTVRLIRLETNKGPSAARNEGGELARGKWLAWLDSDDVWHRNKLKIQVEWLEKLNDLGENVALSTGYEYLFPGGNSIRKIPVPASDARLFFSGCWFCPGTCVMLSRSLFKRVGPYDENLLRLEDLDWFARMALAGGHLEVVPEVLATLTAGAKPAYEKVVVAGNYLREKYSGEEWNLPADTQKWLAAYMQVEYAATAIKGERRYLVGLLHLAISWATRPRTTLHLHKFWR